MPAETPAKQEGSWSPEGGVHGSGQSKSSEPLQLRATDCRPGPAMLACSRQAAHCRPASGNKCIRAKAPRGDVWLWLGDTCFGGGLRCRG